MKRQMLAAALMPLLMSCYLGDFIGDREEVYFRSNLSVELDDWNPDEPIALGTRVEIRATDVAGLDWDARYELSDGSYQLDGDPVLTDLDPTPAPLAGTANGLGTATVTYQGVATLEDGSRLSLLDTFSMTTAEVDAVRVVDPILRRAPNLKLEPTQYWPDIGGSVLLAEGPTLSLEILVEDASGVLLGYADTDFEVVGSTDRIRAEARGHFVHLQALSGASGEQSRIRFQRLGTDVLELPVEVVGLESATELEVSADWVLSWFAVKATAYDAAGRAVYQVPIVWELPPEFIRDSLEMACGLAGTMDFCQPDAEPGVDGVPDRPDILLVRPVAAEEDPPDTLVTRTIAARLGTLTAETEVEFRTPVEHPPRQPTPSGCGGCMGSGAAPMVSGLAVAAVLLRRRRRR